MNRRNFFKSLSLFAAGLAVSPLKLKLPKQIRGPVVPALYHKATRTVTINPEWLAAPYEFAFYHGDSRLRDPYPLRFRTQEDAQAFIDYVTAAERGFRSMKIVPNEKIKLCDTPSVC